MTEIGIEVLPLGTVRLPAGHPRQADGHCTILGFVIHHPDGPVLVDTGVADDHGGLNELYAPASVPIVEALNSIGLDERDLVAIVNTHLHFDHCGQNRFLPSVPVYVQADELAAIELPRYTIPEWATIDPGRRRVLHGDEEIATGIRVLATPGHTPGHQSIAIDHGDRRSIIVGQCCYTCAEFESVQPLPADMHDESLIDQGIESLQRLRRLDPATAHFSHDTTVFRPPGRDRPVTRGPA